MDSRLFLSITELQHFTESTDWADKSYALLLQQQASWDLLSKNYDGLAGVESKDFEIGGFMYRVQFNPGRIVSSSAKVDEQSIRERRCFLCCANLPDAQRGLRYDDRYIILCNPFPIFTEHFTIPHRDHVPQQIKASFPDMLRLSRDLSARYAVLYNGPRCGASAPDHLHFQAGEFGFLPIENQYEELITQHSEKLADVEGLLVFAGSDSLRRFVSLESDNETLLRSAFDLFYRSWQEVSDTLEEPLINLISSYSDGEWRVVIFPRAKHRPSMFFEEGDAKMLISPAAVDLGGVITMPVERDFRRITENDIIKTFQEVVIPQSRFEQLTQKFKTESAQLKT